MDRETLHKYTVAFLSNEITVDAWFAALFEYSYPGPFWEKTLRNTSIDAIRETAKRIKAQLEH